MSDTKNLKVALKIEADLNSARQEIAALSKDLGGLGSTAGATGKAAAKIADDLNKVEKSSQAAGQAFVYAGKSSFSLRTILASTSQVVKIQADDVARLVNTYDAAEAATQALTKDQAMLRRAYEQGAISQQQYERASVNLLRRQQMLSSSYSTLRGSMSNVGFQLQDIAVQMQMGVNPAVILSQQGSQLVSSFNPLAGAVIAVTGALAGALIPALFGSSAASAELNKKIKELNESYETLDDNQRAVLAKDEKNKQQEIQKSIAETRIEVKKLADAYADVQEKSRTQSYAAIGATGGAMSTRANDVDVKNANDKLIDARGRLATKNQELTESVKELRRINGEKVDDDKELLKQTNQLVEKLKEETGSYQKSGEALGIYMADKLKLQGPRRIEIIDLYKKQEAQKKATEAEREAAAEEKSRARQAEATAKNNETYVKNLEAQAAALTQAAQVTASAELAERGLTGELLRRAQAARQLLDADKERQKTTKENNQLAQLELQLLRAQGETSKAALLEVRTRYQSMLEGMSGDAKVKGQEIVDKLIDVETLAAKMDAVESSVSKVLSDLARQEDSINVQREAGLISEFDARSKIVDLHKQTYELLEKQRPVLEELSKQPGAVGEAASKALQELDAQAQRLQATTGLLQSTLKRGLEGGLENAIMGLADGTKSFGDAVRGLGQSVAQALAQMAAQAIASNIVGGLFPAGGGGFLSVLGLASGGEVRGPGTTTSDSIPTMLSNREYVTRAAVVMQPGALDFLHDFNRHGMAALSAWAPVYHSTGGLAGVPAPAMPSPSIPSGLLSPAADPGAGASLNNNIFNILDPEVLDDYLQGAGGNKFIVNWMRRNTTLVQKFAGVKG